MNGITRALRRGLAGLMLLSAMSCGGGDAPGTTGSTSSTTTVAAASNVVSVTVDGGPTATSESVNTLYTTVTICVPGSTTACQTIDHVQVDTGSYGFRVLASVLTLSLPVAQATDGNSLVECTQFVDGYSWGPISSADVQVGGETAGSVPIQVIGSSSFTSVPDACSSVGPAEDTVATFGANGILGIGVFAQDCGSGCAASSEAGFYYSCSQASCSPIAVPLTSQVLNPVPLFATDNNGTIIDLPAVGAAGAATVAGSLIFGIDTQTNNASGTQTVLAVDPDVGSFTIIFNGQSLSDSFIDSGTNGIFFNDSAIAACTNSDYAGFYCPPSTQDFSATLQAAPATGVTTPASVSVSFSVANAQTLFTNDPTFTAFPDLAGTYASSDSTFDFGLPFYFGRRVATAIEDHSTSVGTGPYVAF